VGSATLRITTLGARAHGVDLEPYRVVYYGGRLAPDRQRAVHGHSQALYPGQYEGHPAAENRIQIHPRESDAVLRGSANICFSGEPNLEVKVLIDNKVSHYFKWPKMFPTQEIKEERPDGSLVVVFHVGHFEAICDILKSWIPTIVILEPEELSLLLTNDVKHWLKKHTATV